MSRSPKLLLVLLGSILLAAAACGAVPADLYAAATPVPDQSAAARTAAFTRDLATVLVKVSGDTQAPESATLASTLASAESLVLEYRYQTRTGAASGFDLWARFDSKAVDAALTRAGEPIWGRERPSVLAWVLAPSGIVSDDPANPVGAAMSEAADRRGLPLLLPLMDLEDQKLVSAFDIRTQYLPDLRSAAKRYGTQALLVGTLRRTASGVAGNWTLAVGGNSTPFGTTAPSPATAAAAAVGQAATLLAEEFAQVASSAQPGSVAILVDHVRSLEAEAAVERLIAGIQGISAPQLVSIAGDAVRFEAAYSGTPHELERALVLSGALVANGPPAGSSGGPATQEAVLRFTYSP